MWWVNKSRVGIRDPIALLRIVLGCSRCKTCREGNPISIPSPQILQPAERITKLWTSSCHLTLIIRHCLNQLVSQLLLAWEKVRIEARKQHRQSHSFLQVLALWPKILPLECQLLSLKELQHLQVMASYPSIHSHCHKVNFLRYIIPSKWRKSWKEEGPLLWTTKIDSEATSSWSSWRSLTVPEQTG